MEMYHEIHFNSSNYFEKCWLKTNKSTLNLTVDIYLPEPQASIMAFVVAMQVIAGIVLNFLVIASLLRNQQLRNSYLTPSIVSIAITDLLFSFLSVVTFLYYAIRDMALPTGCQPYQYIFYLLWMCSALNLLGIAALRCLMVYFPGKAQSAKFQQASKVIPILAWIVSVLWLLPTSIGKYGQFGLDCKILMCKFINQNLDGSKSNPEKTYALGIIGIGILILLLNVLTYIKISAHTRSMLTAIGRFSCEETTKKILEKERKLGKMVTLIIASFFIVYFPLVFLRIADPEIMTKSPKTYMIFAIFGSSIGIIDPLVYIVFNEDYRTEVKSLINDTISFVFPRNMYPDA